MRILAIRGKNLASLAGEFELNFRQDPLAAAGLFAICGPTGSGKSTLLDALCLALYDDTPRLTRAAGNRNLPDVGKDTITPQDPRNLLRRGTGEGFAEVDFIGKDGIEYRSRWSVRRARGKAGETLQSTELTLKTLNDGQPVNRTKEEFKKAILERVGLSFTQFTRTVLLAQNEFAAFLKANDNERAELLQKLTGLDVYTNISEGAFKRAKAERDVLNELNNRLTGQQPLDDEARVLLEQALTAAKTETVALEQRKSELESQQRWHQQWRELQQQEQQALETLQNARTAQQAAAPRQQQLTQVDAVQEARPVVEAVDRAATEVDQRRQAVQNAEQQQDEAQRRLQQAEAAKTQANQAVKTAEQQRTDAADALNQARNLDTEINTLTPSHGRAANDLNKAQQAEAEVQKQLDSKQAEHQQVAQHLQTAQAWLNKHQPLQTLAEYWDRWDVLLKEAATWKNSLREAEQKVGTGHQDLQKKQQERDKATDQCAKAEITLQAAQIRLQSALVELAGFDTETLATQRQTAQLRADQLTHAEQLWTAVSAAQTQQHKIDNESRTLQEQVAQAETALNQLAAEKPTTTARCEQAEKSLKNAEAANTKSVETLRASLETGSPCPVCGAIDHPYATGDAPSRAMLTSLKAEVDECRKALETLVDVEATQRTRCENHRQRLTDLIKEHETQTAALQQDTASFNAHPLAAEMMAIASADRSAWFADQQQLTRNDLATLTQQENAQRKVAKQRDDAQQARDQAQKQYSKAQNALNAAQIAFEKVVKTAQTAQERQADCAAQLAERLNELDAAFSGYDWRPLWQTDPVQFHSQRQQKVAQWKDQSQNVEKKWQKQIDTLEVQIKNLEDTAADKATQCRRVDIDFQNIDRDLQARRRQRQALFNGRAVADVEAEFTKAIDDARCQLEQQEEIAQKARQEQISAEATLKQEQKALAGCQEAAAQATADLQRWIADFNNRTPDAILDVPTLRALLVHDSAWLKQEREALRTLEKAVEEAENTFKIYRSQKQAHEQQRASPDSSNMVQEVLEKAQADLTLARARATEAEFNLRQDNERREKNRDLQVSIIKQEGVTRIWNQLSDLIGSADGTKFRNHAQQFTLDVLLGYANHHLADISRRYRLERVPDTLALMVIDQDMGDERRSVHSLSGGESFLVSLALALGLASLSSNRVRVESLFIDEGFGSLDADTLRIAMDALDRLQAQGRKVGVISHVQEMTERIGVQIHIRRQSGGKSCIEVRGV